MSGYIHYRRPPQAPAPEPIERLDPLAEWRVGRECVRLGFSALQLLSLPRGRGTPVVLIPGWRSPEASMEPMRQLLKYLGYNVHHWGQGWNLGEVEADSQQMVEKVRQLWRDSGQQVALIGWSLGGVIAREAAREISEAVSMVITYGSPIVGGPAFTVGASSWDEEEIARIQALIEQRNREQPIPVPLAVIFTRHDRIVSWPACLDHHSPKARHFEVQSSHLSLGMDPDVWKIVARQLSIHTRR